MQGDNPEYTESSAGEYLRSYDTEDDVLGHQRSGFLWTAAQAAAKSVRNYGEFTQFETKPATATWQQYYCVAKQVGAGGDASALLDPSIRTDTESPIPSLNRITDHDYPKFDTDIPDIYRYQVWKQDFESGGPANLNMFWLSSDHTGGTPDPEAQVADGDLAVGQIVDEISHSKWWKSSGSSSSRTTARTAPTMWTGIGRRSRSSARGPSTAPWTTATTPRSPWCGRSSRSSAPGR